MDGARVRLLHAIAERDPGRRFRIFVPLTSGGAAIYVHAKLMIVDGAWSLFGSANLDPRSLRLNFEFCVECYDQALARRLGVLLDQRFAAARRYHLHEHQARGLPRRLRDGVARLALPYL